MHVCAITHLNEFVALIKEINSYLILCQFTKSPDINRQLHYLSAIVPDDRRDRCINATYTNDVVRTDIPADCPVIRRFTDVSSSILIVDSNVYTIGVGIEDRSKTSAIESRHCGNGTSQEE